jgi:hypothetical protein
VRDYLLRFAQEDGTLLQDSESPVEDLMVVLRARPKERGLVEQVIADLRKVGYLRQDGRRLWLPRFEEAQEARSPGAKRQQKLRDKKRHSGDVTSDVTDNVTSDAPETSPKTRRDENRTDETPAMVVDSDRETPCPMDLAQRLDASGAFKELAEKLKVSIEALRVEADRFVGYWTIGGGAGSKRSHWARRMRQWLVDKAQKGELPRVSAVASSDDTGGYGKLEDWG